MPGFGAIQPDTGFFLSRQWKSQVNIWSLMELSADAKFFELRTRNPAWKALRGVDISALSNYSDQKSFQADSALHHAEWSFKLIIVLSSDNGLVAAKKLRDNIGLFSLLFLEFVDIFFQEHIELKQLFVT